MAGRSCTRRATTAAAERGRVFAAGTLQNCHRAGGSDAVAWIRCGLPTSRVNRREPTTSPQKRSERARCALARRMHLVRPKINLE